MSERWTDRLASLDACPAGRFLCPEPGLWFRRDEPISVLGKMQKQLSKAFASVRAALMRRGRSTHDAEDLVQEAWLRMSVYERDQPVNRPDAFLMRTALNLSVDMHRDSVREGEVLALTDDLVIIDTAPSVEATVLARERTERLQVCMARLSDRTREILIAYRVEGLTYKQIGKQYGVSKSTVEWHVSRGVELITNWMEEW